MNEALKSELRVLVTGGAGFIGSNLVHTLLPKKEVSRLVVLDSLTYSGCRGNLIEAEQNEKFSFAKIDLRDVTAVSDLVCDEGFDAVFHLAAESHVDRSITGPSVFVETNVVGTINLLEACRAAWEGGFENKRFLHISTDEVFGSLGSSGAFTEDSPYRPNSPYSASKAGADHLVRAYNMTYGFPAVITNCSNNFGPFQFPEKLIPLVIDRAVNKERIPVYGDGSNVRDWIYVADHVSALWAAFKKGEVGESYNIGGGNEWPNLQVVETICDLVDSRLGRESQETRQLISMVKDRPGHDFRYAIDATKCHEVLDWKPEYEFKEALEATVTWYLENQSWVELVQGQSA